MAKHKAADKSKRLVWRISDRAPLGEWVDPSLPPAPPKKDVPDSQRNVWTRSSFDLLSGVDVTEGPNTVPDDLFDELFRPAGKETKPPRE